MFSLFYLFCEFKGKKYNKRPLCKKNSKSMQNLFSIFYLMHKFQKFGFTVSFRVQFLALWCQIINEPLVIDHCVSRVFVVEVIGKQSVNETRVFFFTSIIVCFCIVLRCLYDEIVHTWMRYCYVYKVLLSLYVHNCLIKWTN